MRLQLPLFIVFCLPAVASASPDYIVFEYPSTPTIRVQLSEPVHALQGKLTHSADGDQLVVSTYLDTYGSQSATLTITADNIAEGSYTEAEMDIDLRGARFAAPTCEHENASETLNIIELETDIDGNVLALAVDYQMSCPVFGTTPEYLGQPRGIVRINSSIRPPGDIEPILLGSRFVQSGDEVTISRLLPAGLNALESPWQQIGSPRVVPDSASSAALTFTAPNFPYSGGVLIWKYAAEDRDGLQFDRKIAIHVLNQDEVMPLVEISGSSDHPLLKGNTYKARGRDIIGYADLSQSALNPDIVFRGFAGYPWYISFDDGSGTTGIPTGTYSFSSNGSFASGTGNPYFTIASPDWSCTGIRNGSFTVNRAEEVDGVTYVDVDFQMTCSDDGSSLTGRIRSSFSAYFDFIHRHSASVPPQYPHEDSGLPLLLLAGMVGRFRFRKLFLALSCLGISACGGGGGQSSDEASTEDTFGPESDQDISEYAEKFLTDPIFKECVLQNAADRGYTTTHEFRILECVLPASDYGGIKSLQGLEGLVKLRKLRIDVADPENLSGDFYGLEGASNLSQLENLEHLELRYQGFRNMPAINCSKLNHLDLARSLALIDKVTWEHCDGLTYLDISGFRLPNVDWLTRLTSLETLIIKKKTRGVVDSLVYMPRDLSSLKNLRRVEITDTTIRGLDAALSTLPAIESLELGEARVSARLLAEATTLKELSGYFVTDPRFLAALTNLESLNVDITQVGFDRYAILAYAELDKLKTLYIYGHPSTMRFEIFQDSLIEDLWLEHFPFHVDSLAKIPNLKRVNIPEVETNCSKVAELKALRPEVSVWSSVVNKELCTT